VHLPWYGLLLALGICGILFVPIGIVMAITNQQSSLYLICQMICGVVFPGRPVANMVFVTYGYVSPLSSLISANDNYKKLIIAPLRSRQHRVLNSLPISN
jgi:hypothetical protein